MKKFVELTKSADGEIHIVGTNETVDRDGDIVRAKGVDTKNFAKNPVMLFAHNWNGYPVAKATKIRKEEDKIIFVPEFADTEEGRKVKYLVENGFLKMTSIGFIPKKVLWKDDFETLKELDPEWYNARKKELSHANRVIFESELLELSFVPIPANPSAEIVMQGKGLNLCAFKAPKMTVEESDDELLIEISGDVKKVVPFKDTPVDMEARWDGRAAIKALREWASDADGNINFAKYRQGFAWYDAENADNLTAYKLPHHFIENGKLVAIWRGVVTAMAALLGARGGVDIPDEEKKSVYNHLAKHYKAVDRKPPEFRKWEPREVLAATEEDGWDEAHKEAYFADMTYKEWKSIIDEETAEMKKQLDELEAAHVKLKAEHDTLLEKITAPADKSAADHSDDSKKEQKSAESDAKSTSAKVEFEVEGVSPAELNALLAKAVAKTLNSKKGE